MEPLSQSYENNLFSKNHKTLHKSHNCGNRFGFIDETITYDDMILFEKVPSFKISQITLYSSDKTIYGYQIIYNNSQTNEFYAGANTTIEPQNPDHIPQTLKLADDDYIILIKGRCGAVIDYLRFETKQGKILEGGSIGTDFELKAKNDFYFSNFGGTLSVENGHLVALSFDEMPIQPPEGKINEIRSFKNFRTIFKLTSDYLEFTDLVNIFSLNSHIYSLRYDLYCLNNLASLALKSVNNQYRCYLKNLMKNEKITDEQSYNNIKAMIKFTSNKLMNPYGAMGFEYWKKKNGGFVVETFLTQPYRTHCFAGTYYESEVYNEFLVNELFDGEFIEGFLKGHYIILAGGYIARRFDCGSKGYINLKVYNEAGEIIFGTNVEKNQLNTNYETICIKYKFEKVKIPHKFKFCFGGIDLKFWAGNYGPRFSGLFIRGYKASYLE